MASLSPTRFARRAWRGLRRRAARVGAARSAVMVLGDVPRLLARSPRLAVAVARADLADPMDPAMLPLVEGALERHRANWFLARRADLLTRPGAFTAARHTRR